MVFSFLRGLELHRSRVASTATQKKVAKDCLDKWHALILALCFLSPAVAYPPFFRWCPAKFATVEKKPARWNSRKVFHRAGLLVDKPPGTAGLPFI
jgi:hypothetical protein